MLITEVFKMDKYPLKFYTAYLYQKITVAGYIDIFCQADRYSCLHFWCAPVKELEYQ